jgi:bZIP transcription factor
MSDIEAAMQLAADAAAGAISTLKRKTFDGADNDNRDQQQLQLKQFKTESAGNAATLDAVPPQTSANLMSLLPPMTMMATAPEVHVVVNKPEDSKPAAVPTTTTATADDADSSAAKPVHSKVREVRLDQNRKAARESRRRKKVMIEELQRSVIFFSRANGTLKQQNDDLTRLLMQAQSHVAASSAAGAPAQASVEPQDVKPAAVVSIPVAEVKAPEAPAEAAQQQQQHQQAITAAEQAHAQAVATQAMFESQGYPAAAARAAAQTMNASLSPANMAASPAAAATATSSPSSVGQVSVPTMTPGATMQAMANFQQAAAAAMQSAIQGMQGIPGVNLSQLAATPAGANAQQAYTDTMTALAMQQAAAAAGHQFLSSMQAQQHQQQHMGFPMMGWPTMMQQQPTAAALPQQQQQQHHMQPPAMANQ